MKQVVLVTGCSSGFGEAIATGFQKAGYTTVASMRNVDAATSALRTCGAEIVALDVTRDESRKAVVDDVIRRHGRLDVLVNNAGVSGRGPVEDIPLEMLRSVMETNFFGPFALTQLVLPHMRRQKSGRIVNVTAIGALLCTPFLSAYCASKHALDAVGAALDVEARALGIRTTSVLPGQFKTAIGAKGKTAEYGAAYRPVADILAEQFKQRAAEAPSDLSAVVNAVMEAATAADPKPRYVVGGGSALLLPPVVEALESIHRIEHQRTLG
ncbi:MAG TPA: SDR family oxidoreductase [Burkholderiaceae bacterium]|nr:SDR family oxidoreductase [Burkholderiaceae bacterium]